MPPCSTTGQESRSAIDASESPPSYQRWPSFRRSHVADSYDGVHHHKRCASARTTPHTSHRRSFDSSSGIGVEVSGLRERTTKSLYLTWMLPRCLHQLIFVSQRQGTHR